VAESPESQAAAEQRPAQQPKDNCPDPSGPYVDYQVDAAGAKKEDELFQADAVIVDQKDKALDGAQGKYSDAKTAQTASYKELKDRLNRITETLNCVIEEETRKRLTDCWNQVLADTEAATTPVPCDAIDQLDCGKLPGDIAQLRNLAAIAASCVSQADTTFDDLAGLPASLAATISGLSGRATALEQEVCGPRADLERSYVEYLQLKRDVSGLDRNWVSPTAYGCNLKADFVTLLHRHMVSICLQVAIFRWEKRKTLEDAAKQARAKNLIDLVLECAHPKLHEPQGTSQGEGQKQPYQAPPSSVSQPQGA